MDLHAAVADSLGQESKRLGADVVLGVLVGGQVDHELDQVLQVLSEKSRLVSQELLEDLESLAGLLVVAGLDSVLEDVDHGRNEGLESRHRLLVLEGLEHEQHRADGHHRVDADIGALRVAEGVAEELQELGNLIGEGGRVLLQQAEDDVRADLPLPQLGAARQGEEGRNQVRPLAVLEVDGGDGRNKPGVGMASAGGLLVHGGLDKVLAHGGLLLLWDLLPVLDREAGRLDGCLLAHVDIFVLGQYLHEEEQ